MHPSLLHFVKALGYNFIRCSWRSTVADKYQRSHYALSTDPGIYDSSNFLDHLITFNWLKCLWSKNIIYCQEVFWVCLQRYGWGCRWNRQMRTAINGHKVAVERSAQLIGKPLKEQTFCKGRRWNNLSGFEVQASDGQNIWLPGFWGFFSQDSSWHNFMSSSVLDWWLKQVVMYLWLSVNDLVLQNLLTQICSKCCNGNSIFRRLTRWSPKY